MKFTVVKRGYDTNEVDGYIEKCEQSLEKYRKMELAISHSMISAEMTREKIIADAQSEAKAIIDAANLEVSEQVGAIKKMLESEKKALGDFCSEYDSIIKTYFTANATEITAPLNEKLIALESIIKEMEESKAEKHEEVEETASDGGEAETANTDSENSDSDPFGEIKNYF